LWWFKTQQLILGTGTAIWWVTEPHCTIIKNKAIIHLFINERTHLKKVIGIENKIVSGMENN
jgi:hypothetical protein